MTPDSGPDNPSRSRALSLPANLESEYRIERQLGSGLLQAVRLTDRRRVAIRALAGAPDATVAHLDRNLAALARAPLHGIVEVLELRNADGRWYLVSEFLPGGSLREFVDRNGALGPERAVEITLDVLHGLRACQQAGIRPRPLALDNILFDEAGRAKIAGLGSGPEASPESNVQALGLILHHMLLGRPPTAGDRNLLVPTVRRARLATVLVFLGLLLLGLPLYSAWQRDRLLVEKQQSERAQADALRKVHSLARRLEREGRAADAADAYRAYLLRYPQGIEAVFTLAELLDRHRLSSTAFLPDPSTPGPFGELMVLSLRVLRAGRPPDPPKLAALERVIRAELKNLYVLVRLSQIWRRRSWNAAADSFLDRARQLDPDAPSVIQASFLLLFERHAWRDAEQLIRAALVKPKHAASAWAHSNLARVLLAQSRLREGEAECEAVLRLEPRSAEVHAMLGQAKMNARDWTGALQAYRQWLRCDPESVEARLSVATALVPLGRKDEACGEYTKVLQMENKRMNARLALAGLLCEAKRFPEAEALYRQGLILQPGNAELRREFAWFLRDLGRYAEGLAVLAPILRAPPEPVSK